MPLTPTEELFVNNYLAHGNATLAAREAGYPNPAALMRSSVIREQIDIRRAASAKTHGYTIDVAMREAKQGMLFAKRTNNANAYAKCVELRMKVNGLLIDRVDARLVGAFTIRIEGIDDDTRIPALPAPVLTDAAKQVTRQVVEQLNARADAAAEEETMGQEQEGSEMGQEGGNSDIDSILEELTELPPPNPNPLNVLQLPTEEQWEDLL